MSLVVSEYLCPAHGRFERPADILDGFDPVIDPSQADCVACLTAASKFGAAATARLRAIRPKDWNACPYESHADDCDCGGRAGDR